MPCRCSAYLHEEAIEGALAQPPGWRVSVSTLLAGVSRVAGKAVALPQCCHRQALAGAGARVCCTCWWRREAQQAVVACTIAARVKAGRGRCFLCEPGLV